MLIEALFGWRDSSNCNNSKDDALIEVFETEAVLDRHSESVMRGEGGRSGSSDSSSSIGLGVSYSRLASVLSKQVSLPTDMSLHRLMLLKF